MAHRMEGERKLEDNWVFSSLWKNRSIVEDYSVLGELDPCKVISSGVIMTFVKGTYI